MLNDVAIHSDDDLENKILVFQDGYWRAVKRSSAMSQSEYIEKFISQNNQTAFLLSYLNLENIAVFTNGILEAPGDDYILTDDNQIGTKIVFFDARDYKDVIVARYLR